MLFRSHGGSNSKGRQFYAFAGDMNSASPTYYFGPFGRATKRIDNSALMSDAACLDVANAELRKSVGLAQSLSFTSLQNPALDVGDVIMCEFLDLSTEFHIVDDLSLDFNSGSMSVSTRSQIVSI